MKAEVSRGKRERIYRRDGYACWYCGRRLLPLTTSAFGSHATKTDRTLIQTLDHLDPRVRGGYDLDSNLVTACRACNSRKGKKTLEEYRTYLENQQTSAQDTVRWIEGEMQAVTFYGERVRAA